MWARSRCLGRGKSALRAFRRSFLSDGFSCEAAWRKRLEAPALARLNLDDLYYQMDVRHGQTGKVDSLDVDLFVNMTTNDYLDEMQDLVHRFRLCREACNALPSTQHAFVRTLYETDRHEDLLNALDDRLNFGVFLDHYSALFLLNGYIRSGDFTRAAKVAVQQMLQEDFYSELCLLMSVYACHKHLLNPGTWHKVVEEPPPEDDEEVKVRVMYLRNEYFDGHFDLKEPNDLVGKTLLSASRELPGELAGSYQVMGLVLLKRLEEAVQLMSEHKVHRDCLEVLRKLAEGSEEVRPALDKVQLVDSDSLTELEQRIKKLASDQEPQLLDTQQKVYDEWVDKREQLVAGAIERDRRQMRLEEVSRAKEMLVKKEEELFFFDREEQIDLVIEKKKKKPASPPQTSDFVPYKRSD